MSRYRNFKILTHCHEVTEMFKRLFNGKRCFKVFRLYSQVTAVTVTNPLLHTASNMTQFYKYGIDIKVLPNICPEE